MPQWKRQEPGIYTFRQHKIFFVAKDATDIKENVGWWIHLGYNDVVKNPMGPFPTLKRAKEEFQKEMPKHKKIVISLMTKEPVEIQADTPLHMDPSSETYWSM